MSEAAARRAAEAAARESYGRLVAFVAARTGDIAAAEDALSGAFAAALETWAERGVPDRPEAWLLTVARREAGRTARRARVAWRAVEALAVLAPAEAAAEGTEPAMPDDRLRLMLACAHPLVDPALRAPLMLQCVLGLDAKRVAAAFLVPPATMGQRLVRAKARLKAEGAAFEEPSAEDLPARLEPVLVALYAAFGVGWDAAAGADPRGPGLVEEAVRLARLVAGLAPGSAEALGLVALTLHVSARAAARRDASGRYVPLDAQDPALWDAGRIAEAEAALARAAALGAPGRFQIEAAIQSVHAARARTGRTDWAAAVALHDWLDRVAPSFGGAVARAAALGRAGRAAEGLAALDGLPRDRAERHQPYWAARAHLLGEAGDPDGAAAAYDRALGLSEDPAVRAFLAEARMRAGAVSPRRG